MRVLLSINPEHVNNIFSGGKEFEFRRKIFVREDVRVVMIYCTKPVQKIVGEFDIDSIICEEPARLWEMTKEGAGIDRLFFDKYFAGRDSGYAIKIGPLRKYHSQICPEDLIRDFTPPQSYMYVPDSRILCDERVYVDEP